MNSWKNKKVYIASPYTKGDVALNVRKQIDTVDYLISLGFLPFAPLYYHFQHMVHPRPYEDWLSIDLEWVEVCDCVLRLTGESEGANKEVELAEKLGIPVFYTIDDMCDFYNRDASKKKS